MLHISLPFRLLLPDYGRLDQHFVWIETSGLYFRGICNQNLEIQCEKYIETPSDGRLSSESLRLFFFLQL